MKRLLMIGIAVASMNGIGRGAELTVEYPHVPHSHWAYEAITIFPEGLFPRDCYPPAVGPPWSLTRYEFAVGIARAMKNESFQTQQKNDEQIGTDFLERRDALMALRREFAPELSDLSVKAGRNLFPMKHEEAATR